MCGFFDKTIFTVQIRPTPHHPPVRGCHNRLKPTAKTGDGQPTPITITRMQMVSIVQRWQRLARERENSVSNILLETPTAACSCRMNNGAYCRNCSPEIYGSGDDSQGRLYPPPHNMYNTFAYPPRRWHQSRPAKNRLCAILFFVVYASNWRKFRNILPLLNLARIRG